MSKPYQVFNTSTQQIVARHVHLADNPFTRLKGLLGKSELPDHEGLWITPCNSIHSMFMQFKFDAVFIHPDGRILHLSESMEPWRFSKIIMGARAVLELPAGWANKHGLTCEHYLELRPTEPN